MRGVWQFYRLLDGALTEGRFCGNSENLEANTPAGYGAVAGWQDPAYFRVDLATGVPIAEPSPAAEPSTERLAEKARRRRSALFASTEWIRSRAIDRGEPVPAEWLAYWQALRDITAQPGFPASIDWPAPPA